MKLYLYDHCPYCVRVEMVAHYKNLVCEQVYLLNDDEETCYRLINAKQVPILEFDDGQTLAESLDIAKKLDEIGDVKQKMREPSQAEPILEHLATARLNINCLLFPRNVLAVGLPEFASKSAKQYFQRKKELLIERSFSVALGQTSQHKAAVEAMLQSLPALPTPTDATLGWDDVLIYPTLRNLTIVKDLQFPHAVRHYIDTIAAITRTHTYTERAV